MEQDVAQTLFAEGGLLLCLDVPRLTEFGIDLNSWAVGPNFKGVKMIPPGLHFIFYSAISKDGAKAPRTGFFWFVKRKEILVKKWDCHTEQIVDGDGSEENVERIRSGMQDLDRYLGAYPYDSYKKWVSLTNHITKVTLDRVQPSSKQISSVTQVPSCENYKGTEKMEVDEKNLNISLEQSAENKINFTDIPQKRYPDGSSPVDITKHSLDSSYVLECMLANMTAETEILGELQLAFVCFLVGQVYDAFEHWKCLVHLLCTCDEALTKYPKLFDALIGVLHFQLLEAPKDFFVDIITKNNFLTVTLQVFFSNLKCSSTADVNLVRKAERFRNHLTKTFKWDFESEPEEYKPVVVDI